MIDWRWKRIDHIALEPLTAINLDFDHLKRVNVRYGHLVRDEVLQAVANIYVFLPQHRCGGALRWGRVVNHPSTDTQRWAYILSTKIADLIRQTVLLHDIHMAVSIGIAQHAPEDSPINIMNRADKALYRAKTEGRDRIEVEL